ncbi:unnamed protein product [Colias eurytheme]|nr:unnamed protein product [Colias eurytheme]
MSENIEDYQDQIILARIEINNLRLRISALKHKHIKEIKEIKGLLNDLRCVKCAEKETTGITPNSSKDIVQYPQTTTHTKTGWSKEKCQEMANSYKFPITLKDSTTQRTMIIQFMNFYFTGNIDNHYNLTDILLFVQCLIFKDGATTSEDLIWTNSDYIQDKSPASPVFSVVKSQAVIRPEEDIETLVKNVGSLVNKGLESSWKFYKYCNSVLRNSPSQNAPNQELLDLYRLFNFVALTMMRAATKTKAQMTREFLKSQYKSNVTAFVGPTLGKLFCPPCSQAVIKTVSYLNKKNPRVACVFAKLVVLSYTQGAFIKSLSPGITDTIENLLCRGPIGPLGGQWVKSRLDASVLTHTSWHGLGILQMLFDVCDFFRITWVEVYNLTALTCTAETWRAISNYMKTYQVKGKEDPTVPWARVIDDAYLTEYNPQNHIVLASLLMRSLEYAQGDQGNGINNSVWAQKNHHIVEKYSAGSEWLLSQLNDEDMVVEAGTSKTIELASILNAHKKVVKTHNTNGSNWLLSELNQGVVIKAGSPETIELASILNAHKKVVITHNTNSNRDLLSDI